MKRRRDVETERQRDGEIESRSVSPSLRFSVSLSLCLSVSLSLCLCGYCNISAQEPIRLAVLDFAGDGQGKFAGLLRSLARAPGSGQVELLDEHLTRLAARGAGYDGSINLSREEARAFGQSLGCDFYLLGRILITRRAVSSDKFYFEALAGLFVVEARTGALTLFVFGREQAGDEAQASDRLVETVGREWPRCMSAIVSARKRQDAEIEGVARVGQPLIEIFPDDPGDQEMERPVFYQRLKPAYTEQADLMGITATVELEAVFGADGKLGDIQVARWAGFGLDESAIATVRQLSYKPARRDGKDVTIRALVRYNFRCPLPQVAAPQIASPEEIDRIRGSLREILVPKQSPVKRPNF
ncbi:MAG TPA: energy transducer TonB [Blastocatellia bacterium]|nr:energy transducer TonB [Blastocatellia bacterium]